MIQKTICLSTVAVYKKLALTYNVKNKFDRVPKNFENFKIIRKDFFKNFQKFFGGEKVGKSCSPLGKSIIWSLGKIKISTKNSNFEKILK